MPGPTARTGALVAVQVYRSLHEPLPTAGPVRDSLRPQRHGVQRRSPRERRRSDAAARRRLSSRRSSGRLGRARGHHPAHVRHGRRLVGTRPPRRRRTACGAQCERSRRQRRGRIRSALRGPNPHAIPCRHSQRPDTGVRRRVADPARAVRACAAGRGAGPRHRSCRGRLPPLAARGRRHGAARRSRQLRGLPGGQPARRSHPPARRRRRIARDRRGRAGGLLRRRLRKRPHRAGPRRVRGDRSGTLPSGLGDATAQPGITRSSRSPPTRRAT